MAQITCKIDRFDRLCVWNGNVQSKIITDGQKQLSVPGESAIVRLSGDNKASVMNKMPVNTQSLLVQGFAVVMSKENSFLP